MKKKIVGVFVALCRVLSILPMSAFAAYGDYNFCMPGIPYLDQDDVVDLANVLPDGTFTGSAVFDGPAKTLTLTNFNYSGDGFMGPSDDDAVIHFVDGGEIDGDFTIIFYGKNVIECTTSGDNTIFDSLEGGELVLQAGDANSTLELISVNAPSPYGGKPTLGSNTVLTVNKANRMVFERRPEPTGHEHMWGYNMQYDAAAHWDYCHICGAQNTPVAHSDADGNGVCDCGWFISTTPSRVNPNTGVTAEMLG